MIVLAAEQGRVATLDGWRAGVDFISYEQVPLGPFDMIYRNGRWIDRRTTDGEILAVDGRNRKEIEMVCWCGYCDESFFRPQGTPVAKQIVCDDCVATGNNNGEPDAPGFNDIEQ